MKNLLRVLAVTVTTLAFSGVSFAAEKAIEKTEPKTEMKSEKAKPTKTSGEVTAVDAKAGTLTVKAKDKNLNLTADSKAKGALEKVKVGDMVKVTYTEKDGKMNATSIATVKAPKAKAKATGDVMEKKTDKK
jgi:Cu/Ag efflux protein CusF